MSVTLWRGTVEKRGNDIIRRWLNREVVLKSAECDYYDPVTGEIRGNIPLNSGTVIEVSGDIIEVKTLGRDGKPKEANGRVFEFRVRDETKRVEFTTALTEALNAAICGGQGVSNPDDLPACFDHDDVLSSMEQSPSAAAVINAEESISIAKSSLRRVHSNHDAGEDEYLDVSSFEEEEDSEGDRSAGQDCREVRFYKSALLYVDCMNALDSAWSTACRHSSEQSEASAARTPPSSPASRVSFLSGVSPKSSAASTTPCLKEEVRRRTSVHKNAIKAIDSIPLRTRLVDVQRPQHPLRSLLQCDPDEDFVKTIDDLYACAELAKPALDAVLQDIIEGLSSDTSATMTLQSRMMTPYDAADCLQRCSVHSYSTAPATTITVPSDDSFLPPEVIPESCLSGLVAATVTCGSIEQVARVVAELLERDEVDILFLDNRFVHPLGQPPVTDARTLAIQAVSYDGSYHRDIRMLVHVPYDPEECAAGFQCEVLVTLQDLQAARNSAAGSSLDAFSSLDEVMAPYFTRFRSWCSRSSSTPEDEDDAEESRQRMSVLYSREICHRVDLLRQITALSPESLTAEIDTFLDDVSSEEYLEDPLLCVGGYFLQLLQETLAGRDMVMMRSVCSLYFDLDLFSGCVALQREIVQTCRSNCTGLEDGGGDETLSFELETLANLLMREDADGCVYESIQLLEESINLRETHLHFREQELTQDPMLGNPDACENLSSLVSAMMVLATLYEEHSVPSQALTVLLSAKETCLAHPCNEKSLALVCQCLGLIQEQEGKIAEAAEALEQAVELQQQHFGAGHPVCASTLLDLAAVYLQREQLDDAIRVGKAALNLRAGSIAGLLMSSPILADTMMALVPICNASQRYLESKTYIEKSLLIRREFYGRMHTSIAECFVEYGIVCRHRLDYPRAKVYLEFGLKLYYKLLGQRSVEVAHTLGHLAGVQELTGDKKTAMDMYKLAVKIRREVNGAESPELAHVLLLLAQLCFEEDRLDEAETYVGECLSIQQNVHPTAALTSAAAGVSIPDEAVVHILPVLVLHPSAAESASLMGSICKAHVRYNDAKIWFLYAVDVVRAVRGPVNNDIAIILTNLAILNKEVGQMQEAVRLYEEALAIRRQLFKGQSPFIAQSLNNLAVVRKDMGQCAEAKRLFEDAVRMYQACNGGSEESAEVAAAYNNLAGCLHDMDPNSAAAEKFGTLCVSIAERVLGPDHPTTKRYTENWSDYLSKTKSIYLKSSSTAVCLARSAGK